MSVAIAAGGVPTIGGRTAAGHGISGQGGYSAGYLSGSQWSGGNGEYGGGGGGSHMANGAYPGCSSLYGGGGGACAGGQPGGWNSYSHSIDQYGNTLACTSAGASRDYGAGDGGGYGSGDYQVGKTGGKPSGGGGGAIGNSTAGGAGGRGEVRLWAI